MPGSTYGACRRPTAHDAHGLPVGNGDVLAACDASPATLGDPGASIVDVELPRRFVPLGDLFGDLVGKIIAAEGYEGSRVLVVRQASDATDGVEIEPEVWPRPDLEVRL